jgi:hypothetical protein
MLLMSISAPGMSGTWVIQDKLLCGIIVAAYGNDPYAHMITADKMFQDIHSLQSSRLDRIEIGLALRGDIIRAHYDSIDSENKSSLHSFSETHQNANSISVPTSPQYIQNTGSSVELAPMASPEELTCTFEDETSCKWKEDNAITPYNCLSSLYPPRDSRTNR